MAAPVGIVLGGGAERGLAHQQVGAMRAADQVQLGRCLPRRPAAPVSRLERDAPGRDVVASGDERQRKVAEVRLSAVGSYRGRSKAPSKQVAVVRLTTRGQLREDGQARRVAGARQPDA